MRHLAVLMSVLWSPLRSAGCDGADSPGAGAGGCDDVQASIGCQDRQVLECLRPQYSTSGRLRAPPASSAGPPSTTPVGCCVTSCAGARSFKCRGARATRPGRDSTSAVQMRHLRYRWAPSRPYHRPACAAPPRRAGMPENTWDFRRRSLRCPTTSPGGPCPPVSPASTSSRRDGEGA